MKTIIASLLLVAAVCAAQKLELSPQTLKLIMTAQKDCATTEGVDEKFLGRINSAENFPTKEEIKCLSECVLKKMNLMDDAGVFQDEVLKAYVSDPVKLSKTQAILEKCQSKAESSCQRGYDIHKCFFKTLSEST